MKKFSQLDERWGSDTLGDTPYTIAKFGCTITSACMLLSRFGIELTPPEAAEEFDFTSDGLLIWSSISPLGMSLVDRVRQRPTDEYIKKWVKTKNKDHGILLEVNSSHWVVAYYWGILGLYCIDPLGGKKILLKNHYTITGAATFNKNP